MLNQMGEQVNLSTEEKAEVLAIFNGEHWQHAKQVEQEADKCSQHITRMIGMTSFVLVSFLMFVYC